MRRDSFVFYRSFYDIFNKLPSDAEKVEFITAICKYGLDETEVEMSLMCDIAFASVKPNIDAARKRYAASVENGKKGGRPSKNKNLEKPNITYNNLGEPSGILNDNVNVNANDNANDYANAIY